MIWDDLSRSQPLNLFPSSTSAPPCCWAFQTNASSRSESDAGLVGISVGTWFRQKPLVRNRRWHAGEARGSKAYIYCLHAHFSWYDTIFVALESRGFIQGEHHQHPHLLGSHTGISDGDPGAADEPGPSIDEDWWPAKRRCDESKLLVTLNPFPICMRVCLYAFMPACLYVRMYIGRDGLDGCMSFLNCSTCQQFPKKL